MKATIIGLLFVMVASTMTSAQAIPSLSQGITFGARVTKESSTGVFTFDYRATNLAGNSGNISYIDIDITRSPNDAELSSTGLTNGPNFISSLSAAAVQRAPMVPVGISAPAGWTGALGYSGSPQRGFATWGATDEASLVLPAQVLAGLRLTSYGLPGVRSVQVRPDINTDALPEEFTGDVGKTRALYTSLTVTTATIAPTAPPKAFVATEFLNYLISLVHRSRDAGWIKDDGVRQSLLAKLINAKRLLEADKPAVKNLLAAFLNEVAGAACLDFTCATNKPLTSEAYGLLFFNGQFLLANLP